MAQATTKRAAQPRSPSVVALATAAGALLRRLRADRGALVSLVVVVWFAALSLALVPQLLSRMTDRGVRAAVSRALTSQPGISVTLDGRVGESAQTGDAALAQVEQLGARYQAGLSAPVRDVITGRQTVIQSERFSLTDPTGTRKTSAFNQWYLTLRERPGVEQQVKLVAGRMPQAARSITPSALGLPANSNGGQPLPVVEVALTRETAQALGLQVGSQEILSPDSQDPLTAGISAAFLDYQVMARVSGLVEPTAPGSTYWFGDPALWQPTVLNQGNTVKIYGFGLLGPDGYTALLGLTSPVPWQYSWRFLVAADRFNSGNLNSETRALQALAINRGPVAVLSSDPSDVSLRTNLPQALDAYRGQQSLVTAVLSVAMLGLVAVALLVLALVALLLSRRREVPAALLRGRGLSGGQLLAAQLIEGLLLAIPAGLVGYGCALLIVPARASGEALVVALGVALAATALTLLAALPTVRLPLGRLLDRAGRGGENIGPAASRRAQARRIALEVFVVLLAAAGIFLLRRRGLTSHGQESGSGLTAVDPYLALVPILAGLAVGLLALRLYPLPVRLLARLARRGRGLVAFVGLRRVGRQPTSALLPLLALLLAISVAVFMAVMQSSLDTAQRELAWRQSGASFRLDAPSGGSFPSGFDPGTIEGVEWVAAAAVMPHVSTGGDETSGASGITLLALDTAGYQAVTAGTPASISFPPSMLSKRAQGALGTQANPIPAVVSSAWASDPAPKLGDVIQLTLNSSPQWVRVVGVRGWFPSVPAGVPFVVASRQALQAAEPDQTNSVYQPTRYFLRAPDDAVSALRRALAGKAPGASLTSRAATYAAIRAEPLVGGVTHFFYLAMALVALDAAIAGVAALVLTSTARVRDLSYLRTLGLTRPQAFALTAVEQIPPVVVAGVAGALLGVAVAKLVSPEIDLAAFVGTGQPVTLVLDWPLIVLIAAGLTAIVLAAVLIVGQLTRRLNLATVLRLGER